MFKKKITKQSLAELEKVMPVVPEWEMENMVGGVMFVVSGSSATQQVGTSDYIKFVDSSSEYRDILNANISNNEKELLALNVGTSWSFASNDQRASFVSSQLSQFANISKLFEGGGGIGHTNDALAGINVEKRLLLISDSTFLGTYADLMYILAHENAHLSGNISGTGFFVLSEEKAIGISEKSPYFKQISYSMRVKHLKIKMEHENYIPTTQTVRELFGISDEEANMIINNAIHG